MNTILPKAIIYIKMYIIYIQSWAFIPTCLQNKGSINPQKKKKALASYTKCHIVHKKKKKQPNIYMLPIAQCVTKFLKNIQPNMLPKAQSVIIEFLKTSQSFTKFLKTSQSVTKFIETSQSVTKHYYHT